MKVLPDWDDLRVFLAVASSGRISTAAQRLQLDHSTIARRIDRLETALNAKIFDRSPVGVTLTEGGIQMVAHAERIESEMQEITESLSGDAVKPSGCVRIAAPEAFGSCLIAANLDLLHKLYPDVQLDIIPNTQFVSLSKREADIVISGRVPPRGRLKVRKLTGCNLGLYVSAPYTAARGFPQKVTELANHKFVRCTEERLQGAEFRYINQFVDGAKVVFRSKSIFARQNAIASGLGVGLIHRFLANTDERLVPVLPNISVQRTYWLLYYAGQQNVPRIRAVISFLDEIVKMNREALAA